MKRTLNRALNRVERVCRCILVPSWRQNRLSTEDTVRSILSQLKVDCVFDIGANDGGYGVMLRDCCGYSGRIISFEPAPDVFTKLKKVSSKDSSWHVYEYALGRSQGAANLQVHHARTGTSFLPVCAGAANLPGNRIIAQVNVAINTLNEVFPALREEFHFERPFLKMDTQGFDLEVFLGGLDVIESFVGIQSELSIEPHYEGAPFWLDSLKAYQDAGFVLTDFVPSSGEAGLRLREIDCIMARP